MTIYILLPWGSNSPLTHTIYHSRYRLTTPRAQVQVVTYIDDITITSTHTSMSAAKKYIKPHTHKVFVWTKQLTLCSHQTLQIIQAYGPQNK